MKILEIKKCPQCPLMGFEFGSFVEFCKHPEMNPEHRYSVKIDIVSEHCPLEEKF